MSNFQQKYDLWDEFLSVWPASRLAAMTLGRGYAALETPVCLPHPVLV